jgi:hypothetical protein
MVCWCAPVTASVVARDTPGGSGEGGSTRMATDSARRGALRF